MSKLKIKNVRMWLLLVAASGLAAAAWSCAGVSGQAHYRELVANTGQPAMHGINNYRLREIMSDLDTQSKQGDSFKPLEVDQDFMKSTEVAKVMEQSVAKLPALADGLNLAGGEREVYLSLATKLAKHVQQYREASENKNYEGMSQAMHLMMVTCNSCHSTFRELKH